MGRRKRRTIEYSTKAVVELLKQKAQLELLKERGDVTAVNLLIDLERIMEESEPTEKQLRCAELCWTDGLKLKDAGEILGITPQGVYFNLKLLKNKIRFVTERWTANGRYIVRY